MELCVFERAPGETPRLGVVRRNHIVDVEACYPGLIPLPKAEMQLAAEQEHHVRTLSISCPMPGALLRRDAVRVLAQWKLD